MAAPFKSFCAAFSLTDISSPIRSTEFLQVKGVQREVPIHMTEGHAESYEVRVLDVYTKLQALYEAQPLVGKRQ